MFYNIGNAEDSDDDYENTKKRHIKTSNSRLRTKRRVEMNIMMFIWRILDVNVSLTDVMLDLLCTSTKTQHLIKTNKSITIKYIFQDKKLFNWFYNKNSKSINWKEINFGSISWW